MSRWSSATSRLALRVWNKRYSPAVTLALVMTSLLLVGWLFQHSDGEPPPPPRASATSESALGLIRLGGQDKLKPYTLHVYTMHETLQHPSVYLVPDFGVLKEGERVKWVIAVTGEMSKARMVDGSGEDFRLRDVRVVRKPGATLYYGESRALEEQGITSISVYPSASDMSHELERLAISGPYLLLNAPQPFIRTSGGVTVMDLPTFGSPQFKYEFIVGRPGATETVETTQWIRLRVSRSVRDISFGSLIPQPESIDPLRWSANDHIWVTGVGIDHRTTAAVQRHQFYAGIAYGFALSLTLPLFALVRSARKQRPKTYAA